MARKLLEGAATIPSWSSIAGALEGALRFLGSRLSSVEVMGLSGQAFVLHLPSEGGVLLEGRGLVETLDPVRYRLLGWEWESVAVASPTDRDRDAARKAARRAIDAKVPAIANGLFVPEFGLITGYDDARRVFFVSTSLDEQGRNSLPFDRWPAPEQPWPIAILWPRRPVRQSRGEVLRAALANAVRLGRGEGAHTGQDGFETWARALEEGRPVSGAGNAYLVQVVQTSRFQAARFLELAGTELGLALEGAALAYRAAGLELSRLGTLVPYPNGGDLSDAYLRRAGARMLREAAAQERDAIERIAAASGG